MSTRDYATRLLVTQVVKARLVEADKALRDNALGAFDQPGVRDIGVIDGAQIGAVQLTKGRASARVTDNDALLAWCIEHRPDEVVTTQCVRGSYITALLAQAKRDGYAVDPVTGEVVPGVEAVTGEPILTVKASEDAADVIARALADGRLTWDEVATAAIEVSS